MKRPPNDSVLALYSAMLKDIAEMRPALQLEVGRDLERLSRLYENHGESFFTRVLPMLGKHFDSCLAEGTYARSGLLSSKPVNAREAIPRLFRGMLMLVFEKAGPILESPDVDIIRCLRQLYYAVKKLEGDLPDDALFRAYNQFYQDDRNLPAPSGGWKTGFWRAMDVRGAFTVHPLPLVDGVSIDTTDKWLSVDRGLLATVQQVADMVSSSLGEFIPSEWKFRHGPGAVSEPYKNSKFEFGSWTDRLSAVFDEGEFRFHNLSAADHLTGGSWSGDLLAPEPKCKLIAVPKDQRGPRLIASEPISHQFCQQAIRDFLKSRIPSSLVSHSVSITDQVLSQKAALQASLGGEFVTADLSSASDRLSCFVVEAVFRKNLSLLNAVAACRTSEIIQNLDKKQPSSYEMRKYAPMGNATVFPLQSIVYAVYGIAATLWSRGYTGPRILPYGQINGSLKTSDIRRAARSVRIFGDDIIVAAEAWPAMQSLLEATWFKVNLSKTFISGKFRESCGMDAYDGADVTPAYVRSRFDSERPTTLASVVESSNNLYMKGWWNTSRHLLSTLPPEILKGIPVVHPRSGAFGLKNLAGLVVPKISRWNDATHQVEYLVMMVKTKVTKTIPEGIHHLYQWFTDNPGPDNPFRAGEDGGQVKRLTKAWVPVQYLYGTTQD